MNLFQHTTNLYSLKSENVCNASWIARPNYGGDMTDMVEIVDELNKLRWERNLLAILASEKPEFFNPLHAVCAVHLRDKILQENGAAHPPKGTP